MQITSTTQRSILNKMLSLIALIFCLIYSQTITAQIGCKSCRLGYPDNSNPPRSQQVFSESSMLVALDPIPSVCGKAPEYVKVWYTDEHAILLGVRRVIVKTSNGTTTTDYHITPTPASPTCVDHPLVGTTVPSGDQSGNDVAVDGGRPTWPAVFITDLTVYGDTSRRGDWQRGGTGKPPSRICGTWKAAVRTVDKTSNPNVVTVIPDADPAANGTNLGGGDAPPSGTTFDKYSAEVSWKLSDLNLIPGHSYRLQFMVHDGDQNKTGGDAGDTCTNLMVPLAPSSIGDFVWDDKNQNGIQDAGEPGMPNITVTLYDASGNVKGTTFTDAQGKYAFNNVDVSNGCTQYKLGFSPLPTKYTWTKKRAGTDTTLDSNAPNLCQCLPGYTDLFTICPGQSRLDIDAGMFNPGGTQAVTMSSFTGKYENGISVLNWNASSQTDLNSYDIQRSNDGISFNNIGNVKAIKTSSGNSYNFIDKLPNAGLNYYRLKMNETTGYFTYGNIVALNALFKGIKVNTVYPNPFRNQIKVAISSENAEPVTIRITDDAGRLLKVNRVITQKGSNEFLFNDLESLKAGLYIIEVKTLYSSTRTKISK